MKLFSLVISVLVLTGCSSALGGPDIERTRTNARGITGTIFAVDAGSNLKWMRREPEP
jgi:hypothetical protein